MKNIAFAVAFAMLSTAPAYAGSCGGAPHTHGVSKEKQNPFSKKLMQMATGRYLKLNSMLHRLLKK